MKRNLKRIIIPCMAATFALGMSMMSYAATGWQSEDDTWRYYDRNGDAVSNEWKKSGDNWYWLDDEGWMATETLVEDDDDLYYVDERGVMLTNNWRQLENDDDSDDASEYCWYYFGKNGKAYKAADSGKTSFKSIVTADGSTKKYAFDSEGRMLYGWVDEESERHTDDDAWKNGVYYLGGPDDGALRANGWERLEAIDSENEDDEFDDTYWFYFKSNGKKTVDGTKTINGKKYRFGENGNALFKWYELGTPSTATGASATQFYSIPSDCWLSVGWFKTIPGEEIDEEAYNEGEERWFYAKKDGELLKSQIKKINGSYYAFDENGLMLQGLYKMSVNGKEITSYEEIESEDDLPETDEAWDVYYFADSSKEGAMKTGRVTIDLDGDPATYNFRDSGSNRGAGYNGIEDGCVYQKGKLIKADKDSKYEIVTVEDQDYLINTSGKIQKNKTNIKDADDTYYCTDSKGIVTYIGAEKYEK